MSTTTGLYTLPFLCQLLQRTPRDVRKAITALGIAPHVTINAVAYFDDDHVDKLQKYFASDKNN